MALDKRIIAIQMLPGAYDEIQRLKREETWTRFIIQCVLAKVGDNSILQGELASLTKEPKAEKPKKPAKKEKKVAKAEASGEHKVAMVILKEHEPTKAEIKAIETEVPSAEEAERVKIEDGRTLIMPHAHKPKKVKAEKSKEVR